MQELQAQSDLVLVIAGEDVELMAPPSCPWPPATKEKATTTSTSSSCGFLGTRARAAARLLSWGTTEEKDGVRELGWGGGSGSSGCNPNSHSGRSGERANEGNIVFFYR